MFQDLALLSLALVTASCAAPPQLVVVVDTDAPLVGQLGADPGLSRAAAIDTVDVELLGNDLRPLARRAFVVADPSQWPLSFGVAAPGNTPVLLHVRAFHTPLAIPRTVGDTTILEPRAEAAIDRLLELTLPPEGRPRIAVTLSMDCFGAPSNLLPPRTTCIDGARLKVPATTAPDPAPEGPQPTRAGASPVAHEVPCAGPAIEGATCIPGGFSLLGAADVPSGDRDLTLPLLPLRPVRVSPFWMDSTEFTVGRYRALLRANPGLEAPLLRDTPTQDNGHFCTWLGAGNGANDELPVNCVTAAAAAAACRAAGGELPSEARWEHAARGRGEGRIYPWGDAPPMCCTASLSRTTSSFDSCGQGAEAVGSHRGDSACGVGDVSRDGVLDLGGSVDELMLDVAACYDDDCWAHQGSPLDPVCRAVMGSKNTDRDQLCPKPPAQDPSERGGYFNAGTASAIAAFRRTAAKTSPALGFRCVYPDGGR